MASRKSTKHKVGHPSVDIIPLGKSKVESDSSSGSGSRPSSRAQLSSKREHSGSSGLVSKKPKLISQTSHLSKAHQRRELYEELAVDVEPSTLHAALKDADKQRVNQLLCGSVRYLRQQRAHPDPALSLALMTAVKDKPSLLQHDIISEGFVSLLRREQYSGYRSRGNPTVHCLATNLLLYAYNDVNNWPDSFLQAYTDDALGERLWVDRNECRLFVSNVLTAFGNQHPSSVDLAALTSTGPGNNSPAYGVKTEEEQATFNDHIAPVLRYSTQQTEVEQFVKDKLKLGPERLKTNDVPAKNFIKFLIVASPLADVRSFAAKHLESLLMNQKLQRLAQELLQAVCRQCRQHAQADVDVMSLLVRLRASKHKPQPPYLVSAVRELLTQNDQNLTTLLSKAVKHELQQQAQKFPTAAASSLPLLTTILQAQPDQGTSIFAETIREALLRSDCLRSVRMLLRELTRSLRGELEFQRLVLGLMQTTDYSPLTNHQQLAERYTLSITDLICHSLLLSVTHRVKEAAIAYARGDKKDIGTLRQFQQQTSVLQQHAGWWLHETHKHVGLDKEKFRYILLKILFMLPADQYCSDNFPVEAERSTYFRLVTEVQLKEDTLMRVLITGLSRDFPLEPAETLDLVQKLVTRAAAVYVDGQSMLKLDRLELINALMTLVEYHIPQNYKLPEDYTCPNLAVTALYWNAWIILLIICAFNPKTFGMSCWESYPTLRIIMEMVITNTYTFPPPTISDATEYEEIRSHERMAISKEQSDILGLEGHLANKVMTQQTSILLPQCMSLDPKGAARRPPSEVVERLKSLNNSLRLGQALCRSRDPDILLSIINRQGSSESQRWLLDLISSDQSSLDALPIVCLCEFLLQSPDDSHTKLSTTRAELVPRMRDLLHRESDEDSEEEDRGPTDPRLEVLDFFIGRLSSGSLASRHAARQALQELIQITDDEELPSEEDRSVMCALPNYYWLVLQLPRLLSTELLRQHVLPNILTGCMTELDRELAAARLILLCQQTSAADMNSLAETVAEMTCERGMFMRQLIPTHDRSARSRLLHELLLTLLGNYVKTHTRSNLSKTQSEAADAGDDHLLVMWSDQSAAILRRQVIYSCHILLTLSAAKETKAFSSMRQLWCPGIGLAPTGRSPETGRPHTLLPDWLLLTMIGCSDASVVDTDIEQAESSTLLILMQSFALSVENMDKILQLLDKLPEDFDLKQELKDPTYIHTLIEVHRSRGCSYGDVLMKRVAALLPQQQKVVAESMDITEPPTPPLTTPASPTQAINTEQILEQILSAKSNPEHKTRLLFVLKQRFVGSATKEAVNYLSSHLELVTSACKQHPDVLESLAAALICASRTIGKLDEGTTRKLKDIVSAIDSACSKTPQTLHMMLPTDESSRPLAAAEKTPRDRTQLAAACKLELRWKSEEHVVERLLSQNYPTDCSNYLRSLLVHQTGWGVIKSSISAALSSDSIGRLDSSSVIILLKSVLKLPALWRSQDPKLPKNYIADDILPLTDDEVSVLCEHVVTCLESQSAGLSEQEAADLLLSIINSRERLLAVAVKHLMNGDVQRSTKLALLRKLYQLKPCIRIWLPEADIETVIDTDCSHGTSSLDELLQSLVMSLCRTEKGPECRARMERAYTLLTKLSAEHPQLFLRQLPHIASQLAGRTRLPLQEFTGKNQLLLLANVCRLLLPLRTNCCRPQHAPATKLVLRTFLSAIKHHGMQRELRVLINHVPALLTEYWSAWPAQASALLEEFAPSIRSLAQTFPELQAAKKILAMLSLPAPVSEDVKYDTQTSTVSVPRALSPIPAQRISETRRRLQRATSHDEIRSILLELDDVTKKRVEFLDRFQEELLELVTHVNKEIRSSTLMLLIRHLRASPRDHGGLVNRLIAALNSDDPDIVESTLQHLPIIAVLCQDGVSRLLRTALNAIIHHGLEAEDSIVKTLRMLNAEVDTASN